MLYSIHTAKKYRLLIPVGKERWLEWITLFSFFCLSPLFFLLRWSSYIFLSVGLSLSLLLITVKSSPFVLLFFSQDKIHILLNISYNAHSHKKSKSPSFHFFLQLLPSQCYLFHLHFLISSAFAVSFKSATK